MLKRRAVRTYTGLVFHYCLLVPEPSYRGGYKQAQTVRCIAKTSLPIEVLESIPAYISQVELSSDFESALVKQARFLHYRKCFVYHAARTIPALN